MYLIELIYLMLPAYVANMAPVLCKNYFKPLAYSLDFGKKFRGKRILGEHKTMRGLLLGIVAALVVFYIQQMLFRFAFFQSLSMVDYSIVGPILGFLMGFGAVLGDSVGSFIKRQLNVKPGHSLLVLDQLDFVIGALYFMAFIYHPGWEAMGMIIAVSFALHIIVNHIGYFLKINKKKW